MSMNGLNVSRWSEAAYRKDRGGLFGTDAGGVSRTKQEFVEDADVNRIIARFHKTGQLPVNTARPAYMDVSDVPDLQRSLQVIADAEAAFMALPAKVRAEFDNDPIRFVEFANDAANVDRMRELGLLAPLPPAPQPVEVVVRESAQEDAPKPVKGRSKADPAD